MKKVYIVDNHAHNSSLEALLSANNIEVIVNDGSSEAHVLHSELCHKMPNLVITELDHPNLDIWEFFSFLKGTEETKNITLVVYTLNDKEAIKEQAENMNVDYFFSKNKISDIELVTKLFKMYKNKST